MVRDVAALVGPDGWTTWDRLIGQVSRNTVRAWIGKGRLVRVDTGIYVLPTHSGDWTTRVGAVVRQRQGVASHATALALWELVPQPGGPVHVTVGPGRSGRGSADVVLHRSAEVDEHVRRVRGIAVTSVERSLVDTWGHPGVLERSAVRAAAITAVRRRMCRPEDLAVELARRPQLPARGELATLVGLLADGCQSELEIWGCLKVLRAPGMPPFVQQRPVTAAGRRFVLDAACEKALLAVEMDGAAWHGSQEQRERDIHRDALLATVGWQVLRFGFTRMTRDPEACRREIKAVYRARLRLLRPRPGRER